MHYTIVCYTLSVWFVNVIQVLPSYTFTVLMPLFTGSICIMLLFQREAASVGAKAHESL